MTCVTKAMSMHACVCVPVRARGCMRVRERLYNRYAYTLLPNRLRLLSTLSPFLCLVAGFEDLGLRIESEKGCKESLQERLVRSVKICGRM